MPFTTRLVGVVLGFWLSAAVPLQAAVVRWEITRREPYANGQAFGTTGPFERMTGRLHLAIDPQAACNATIVDLAHAPRNASGQVEFWCDLVLLTPQDPQRGNGALLYDVNNRGNKTALSFFNGGDPGDGFLLRHGFTLVWSGWDGELLPGGDRLRLSPPVARDGLNPLTGLVRCEIVPNARLTRSVVNWEHHGSYRPTARGLETATLTRRERPGDPRMPIARDQFTLHVTEVESDSPSQLPKVEIEYPAGMEPGWIYELIYEARDPLVHGVCFAGVRDLMSALRFGGGAGHPFESDSTPRFQRTLGFGVSQSGRFLREFVHAGFNADEAGRHVFDGLLPHVAGGGLGSFNHRFAQPTRHVNQHDHHDYPADRFPFAYETQRDPLSGKVDGILARATVSGTVPLIFHTQSAGEYYTRSGSLVHTDALGTRDAEVPATVRIYAFGGTQHGPAGWPPAAGVGKYLANPGDYRPLLRALLLALDRWVAEQVEPPPSVYPTIAAGTLVLLKDAAAEFPQIPGVEFPRVIQQPAQWNLGPRWNADGIIDLQPPEAQGHYQVLVPTPGLEGNETLGTLLPPEVAVPTGTHTGWNLRRADAGAENELVALGGAYLPFALTKAERISSGDSRLSLQERYGSFRTYIDRLETTCRELVASGYLLEEDVVRIIQRQTQRVRPLFEELSD